MAIDVLDQLSTSQTFPGPLVGPGDVSPDDLEFIASKVEQAQAAKFEKCINGAPFIFFVDNSGRGRVVQGCCNDWTCDRCGHLRALTEYGRIVNGAKELSKAGHKMQFLTLTCRGADMPLETANRDYLLWTNRLLTTARTDATRRGLPWFYVQVTERQKRQHPHSHLITTFRPKDAAIVGPGGRLANGTIAERDTVNSAWLVTACQRAGLGRMVDMTEIRNDIAVAVYVAKYLFKDAMNTAWPKGWRRIRYSQSWPKLPHQKPAIAFPLVKLSDWHKMAALDIPVYADSPITLEAAYARLITCVIYKKEVYNVGIGN